jgi:taurine dioxygenase
MSELIINPLTGFFGAEIIGNISSISIFTILGLLNIYAVLVFRNQYLTPIQFSMFAKKLGKPTLAHPVQSGLNQFPEILEVDSNKIGKNAKWHTDISYTLNPPQTTILQAIIVPKEGGDTLFSDLQSSYKYLSNYIKKLINKLEAIHKITPLAYWGFPFDNINIDKKEKKDLYLKSLKIPAIIHPIVRLHPVTGEPGLFVNPGYTSTILNMSEIESNHLLHLLWEHSVKPEFTLRHKWNKDDIVIWDNSRTMHYAVDDYNSKRIMNRICIEGNIPFGYHNLKSRIITELMEEVVV